MEKVVLDEASFEIETRTIALITDVNGSGKSTILKILGGIEVADAGRVMVDGIDITKLNSREMTKFRREQIGIVFQKFFLDPNLNILKNIEVPAFF